MKLSRQRGAALIMAVFFMTLLFGIGLAFIRLIPGEFFSAQRLQTDTQGYYVADAGVSQCLAWLEYIGPTGVAQNEPYGSLPSPGWINFTASYPSVGSSANPMLAGVKNFTTNPNPGPAPSPGGAWTQVPAVQGALLPGWAYDAQVQRWNFRDSQGVAGTYFVIVSEAERASNLGRGNDTFRRVRCWARPASFSDDAYAVDHLPSDIWLNLNTFKLNGPYRTNDRVLLYTANSSNTGGFWPSASPRPAAINGTISYWQGSPTASPGPVENRYLHTGGNGSAKNTYVDGVRYTNHSNQNYLPYDVNTGAEMPGRYAEITSNGRNGIVAMPNRQDMPQNTANLADIALGTTAPATNLALGPTNSTSVFGVGAASVNLHATTTSTGVFGKTLQGGFYIEGDVDNVTLSTPASTMDGNGDTSDGNYNSQMVIRQGTNNVTITQVYESFTLPVGSVINGLAPLGGATTLSATTNGVGYTVIKDSGTVPRYRVYEGTGNGAIYFTGNVNAFSGQNRGRKTFATRTDTGSSTSYDKRFVINGNITRADTTPGQNVTGVRDQVGIISYKVVLADNSKFMKNDGTAATRASTSDSNPLFIYGAFVLGRANDPNDDDQITGGGFGTQNYDDSGQGIGTFKLFGSLTEGVRQVKSLIGQSGMNYQYMYDSTLSQLPPPFFPAKNRFRIDAWNEEAVFNY